VRARVLVSVAVAATIALGATGCEFMTPQDTKNIKQITDGVELNVGKIAVRNALIISKNGKTGRFAGTVVNNSAQREKVSFQVKDDAATSVDVTIPANTTIDFGSADATPLVFDGLGSKPGSLVKLFVTYPGAEGGSVSVPVLNGTLDEYKTLVPTPAPSNTIMPVSPTGSATPDATETPAAG
jgi:hypothetical protein